MTASQMRIAETIDAFYGDSGAKDGVSRSYKQAVEDLDAETIKALDGPYRYARYIVSFSQQAV
jgi:bridging integrator 3